MKTLQRVFITFSGIKFHEHSCISSLVIHVERN